MKIDQNLRAAIRSYCAISHREISSASQADAEKLAIGTLVSGTPNLRAWKKKFPKEDAAIKALRERAQKLEASLEEAIKPYGLTILWNGTLAINDHEAFAKAGGKLEVKTSRSADAVIAQLAAATPEAGAKILSDLGIKWE